MEEKLGNYFQGKLSHDERVELLRSVESDESLKAEFLKMQNVFALLNLSVEEDDSEEGKESYIDFLKKKNHLKFRLLATRFLKYAAIIAIVVLSSIMLTLRITELPDLAISENTLFVPAGQRAMIKLHDGTEVWLNARTTLVYPSQFTGSERRVFLSGEAFFSVSKNEDMPFIVSTDQADVKVLGTKFNINSYPDAGFSQTSLIEGSVEIYNKEEKKAAVILEPNQQATLKNKEFTVEEITFPNHFLWREGIYCFDNESMPVILKKLEMYFNVDIIVKNKAITDVMVTGKFRQTDGIDEILRILRKKQEFKIEKNIDGDIITIK